MVPIHGYTTPAPPPSCSTDSLQARCSRSPSLDRVRPPSPPCLIDLQGFSGFFDFQGTNAGPRLTLSRWPWDNTTILAKLACLRPRR